MSQRLISSIVRCSIGSEVTGGRHRDVFGRTGHVAFNSLRLLNHGSRVHKLPIDATMNLSKLESPEFHNTVDSWLVRGVIDWRWSSSAASEGHG